MMKLLLPLITVFLLVGCQKEEFKVQDNPNESILNDPQLRAFLNSVSSHDGSVDNVIDNSDCFSIKFPFGLVVDGISHQMTTPEDLLPLTTANSLVPEFPITLVLCDYSEFDVGSLGAWQDEIVSCHSGNYYDDVISCVDINYPIELKMFDANNTNFETITLEHDWDTYSTLASMNQTDLVTINYPISLQLQNGTQITVHSNDELKYEILRIIAICN